MIAKKTIQIVQSATHTLNQLLKLKDFGKWIQEGVRCVIIGQPNAGKSTLLNSLLGQERAIVTPIAGTTRDFIEGTIDLGGILFHFIDTAGYRDKPDAIELLGIRKITQLIRSADVVLWVLDQSIPFTPNDMAVFKKIASKKRIYCVLTKSDLPKQLNSSLLPKKVNGTVFNISSKRKKSISELKHYLHTQFIDSTDDINLDLLCNVRQLACLQSAKTNLLRIKQTLLSGLEEDIISMDLKQTILKLGEVTGEAVTEEVLDGIFSRFCVGK